MTMSTSADFLLHFGSLHCGPLRLDKRRVIAVSSPADPVLNFTWREFAMPTGGELKRKLTKGVKVFVHDASGTYLTPEGLADNVNNAVLNYNQDPLPPSSRWHIVAVAGDDDAYCTLSAQHNRCLTASEVRLDHTRLQDPTAPRWGTGICGTSGRCSRAGATSRSSRSSPLATRSARRTTSWSMGLGWHRPECGLAHLHLSQDWMITDAPNE